MGTYRVQVWQLDDGREFLNFRTWGTTEGILFQTTPPYTAEPNGRIERAGATLVQTARAFLIDSRLPEFLWPYAMQWAATILNLLPTAANKNNESPHEKLC